MNRVYFYYTFCLRDGEVSGPGQKESLALGLSAKSGFFQCWWLRLPMALRCCSPLLDASCSIFRNKHFAPWALSSLQLPAMVALVPEPSARSGCSASLPLLRLCKSGSDCCENSCVSLAQTAVRTAWLSPPLVDGCYWTKSCLLL